jgi:hypothetical protein
MHWSWLRSAAPSTRSSPAASTQRAIGKTEIERADRFLGTYPTAFQIVHRFRALKQALLVILDHLHQQLRVRHIPISRFGAVGSFLTVDFVGEGAETEETATKGNALFCSNSTA